MSLRSRLRNSPETVQEFELASDERFREGQMLLLTNSGAAIYLMGYAAEMLLKNAYFRLVGASPAEFVEPRLGPARSAGGQLIPNISHESYHSIRFWAMLIQAKRTSLSYNWPAQFELDFEFHTERLYNTWWVEMRYRQDRSLIAEATDMLADTTWLRSHSALLWLP